MKRQALVLITLTLVGPVAGQEIDRPEPQETRAPATRLQCPRVPIHTQPDDPLGGVYGTWAAGPGYKVGFHDDMTFVPVLGNRYPRTQSVRWRTTSCRVGDTEWLEPGESPARHAATYRYEYRYRAFVEAYDVLRGGVEQTFVFARRPEGDGDLEIAGRLCTDLGTEPRTPRHGELVFTDRDGRALVRYGAAFAVDADGRRTPLAVGYREGTVRLRVPAAVLRNAVYPLVIDPLLSPIELASDVSYRPDLVYDESAQQYMAVYARANALDDDDVFAVITNRLLAEPVVVFADLSRNWSSREVRVAAAYNPMKLVVAFSRFVASTGAAAIRLHVHDSSDLALRTGVTFLDPPTGAHEWRPELGGTVAGVRGRWVMVVSQREFTGSPAWREVFTSSIVARAVDVSGTTPVVGPAVFFDPGPGIFDLERPTINRVARPESAAETTWVVACQAWSSTGSKWTLIGKQLGSTGSQSSASWVAVDGPSSRVGARIAGSDGRYLIAFAENRNGRTADDKGAIHVERFDWGVGGPIVRWVPVDLGRVLVSVGGCSHDHRTRSHWLITTQSSYDLINPGSVAYDRVGFNGRVLESGYIASPARGGRIAGGVAYRRDGVFSTLWTELGISFEPGPLVARDITYPTVERWSTVGTGCSPATIEWTASHGSTSAPFVQQIGHEYTEVRVRGAPANSMHMLVAGLQPMSTPVPTTIAEPGCWSEISSYFSFGVVATGTGSDFRYALPLPESQGRTLVYFQDWHTNASGQRMQTTQALKVMLVK